MKSQSGCNVEETYSFRMYQQTISYPVKYLCDFVRYQKPIIDPYIALAIERLFENKVWKEKNEIDYFNKLIHYEIIDYQFLKERFRKELRVISPDSNEKIRNYGDYEVNLKFIKSIGEKTPKHYNTFEKVLFAYFYLCDNLHYDLDYAVSESESYINKKYLTSDSLSQVTENKPIICFDFAIIMAKIMDYYQTPFLFDSSVVEVAKHLRIVGNFEELMVQFDSTSQFYNCDFYRVRLKQKPIGIVCLNNSITTQKKFLMSYERVLHDYYQATPNYFEYLEKMRREAKNEKEDLSFQEIFQIFQFFVHSSSLKNYELFSQITQIANEIFHTMYFLEMALFKINNDDEVFYYIRIFDEETNYSYSINQNKDIKKFNQNLSDCQFFNPVRIPKMDKSRVRI